MVKGKDLKNSAANPTAVDVKDESSPSISKGDFLLVDFIGRVKETNELFDVTVESVAKAEKVYSDKIVYRPRLVIAGEGWVVKGLDEEILKMKIPEEKTFELPPDRAFGERDPKAIKVLPLREFKKQNINPYPGMRIRLGSVSATVKNVSSGRVTLDFNLPLAGKTIIYTVITRRKLVELADKVKALVQWRLENVDLDEINVIFKDGELAIELPSSQYFKEGIQYSKKGISRDIYKYIPSVTKVSFIESYLPDIGGTNSS
ncbi:MAG: peptidylprolyl isomerase [Candidatus Odinarchaeum yellowstonii]|uniref:Peptidyl-prolyl cis-trans isomerase n=1 Tax=Odinarchaeota yellowstonii (strain LCB_4) TaxID=1841599 RepID=A0AAF0D334_ODILC|nr:MAG: peptidylprolyl isomerase [Candidatus Odinarchaeum yellowstonii]